MADEVNENIFLVNAPAGSGKTTWIRQQVESYLLHNPKDNILCITYTNRAAEELGRDLEQSRVYFGTIHSFINDFIGSFFSHKEIIDLYWEVYETQIIENKINQLCVKNFNEMDTVIEDTVTAKAQSGDIDEMASLFNSVSFRDFVMTGYKQKCAITGNVIQYKSFMNLEAAHIWPRSHKGLYLPSNGIALCRDMHWAFDKGMFTIGDDFKVIVHPDVESDYLQQYNNKSLYIPENAFFRPDINNLHYHQTHIYGLFKTSGSLVKATGYYKNINIAAEDKTPYGSN